MYDLEVRTTASKGRGVFALRPFTKGECIERCPVILFPPEQRPLLSQTSLRDYYFNWPFVFSDGGVPALALPLGYGVLYNHDREPNASIRFEPRALTIDFYALRDIAAGEEISHHYGGSPASKRPRDFEQL